MAMSTSESLSRFRDELNFVRLYRRFPGEPWHNGFILDVGEELILLNQFHDFHSDGLTALRIEDIDSVKSGPRERLFEEIVTRERIHKKFSRGFGVGFDLSCMRGLLDSLRTKRRVCIIQSESEHLADEDEFSIGRVLSVSDEIVSIKCFDVLGHWDARPERIVIGSVTKCEINTPYINVFSRYLASIARKRKENND